MRHIPQRDGDSRLDRPFLLPHHDLTSYLRLSDLCVLITGSIPLLYPYSRFYLPCCAPPDSLSSLRGSRTMADIDTRHPPQVGLAKPQSVHRALFYCVVDDENLSVLLSVHLIPAYTDLTFMPLVQHDSARCSWHGRNGRGNRPRRSGCTSTSA